MKKRFFRFAILPLLAGILVGCAELNIGTALRNDPAAPGPVKIGVIAPLSGGNRFYGERMLDGVQLAVEEGAEFAQLVQDDEDRRSLCLRIGDD